MTGLFGRRLWCRTVAFGFRLLYNELAWTYDPVSWLASQGRWHRWQRTALPFLPPSGRILEVGFGPGHLLADLARAGYRPTGLDPSPAMLRQASRRLSRQRLAVPLCRGQAQALPFAAQTFDAVVVTFPTPFVYDAGWMRHLHRVLQDGGRLVVVEMASLQRADPAARGLEWLYRVTGQRGPTLDLVGLLGEAGLVAWHETAELDGTQVRLLIAQKAE